MSKKTNTFLFIIGGTIFNIIVTVLCFALFLFAYSRFLFPYLPEDSGAWIIPLIFVLSITASLFIYRQVIKVFIEKVDMEKYFDPVFTRKNFEKGRNGKNKEKRRD